MRRRLFKFAVGTAILGIFLIVGLWLIAPVFAKNKAIEKAQAMGLTMTVDSVNHSDGGFLFEGVHVASTELPIEADIDSVLIQADGSQLRAVTAHGGKVKIHGKIAEVRDQVKAWRTKHHSSGSSAKAAISIDGILLEWKSPCGGEDASAKGISVNNTDLIVNATEAVAICLGWKAHAEGVQASPSGIKIYKLDVVRTEADSDSDSDTSASASASAPSQKFDKRAFPIIGTLPEISIGELSVDDKPHNLHARNLTFRGNSDTECNGCDQGDMAYGECSFDEMDADLPKIHKIHLGKTEAEGHFSDLLSGGYALFSLTVKFDDARGKVQGVTGNKVSFGSTEVVLSGSLPPEFTWASPRFKLDELTHVKIEGVQVNLSGEWNPDKWSADIELPDTDCQKLLDAVPSGMNRAIAGLQMNGSAEIQLHVEKDAKLAGLGVKLHLFDHCKVSHPPNGADRATLRSSFMRIVQGPMGEGIEVPTGPSSSKWTPIGEMSVSRRCHSSDRGSRIFRPPWIRQLCHREFPQNRY
jgi:hypothetical protein